MTRACVFADVRWHWPCCGRRRACPCDHDGTCCVSNSPIKRLHYSLFVACPSCRQRRPTCSAGCSKRRPPSGRDESPKKARQTFTSNSTETHCRTGRVRIGGAGANEARATIEIDFTCDGSHGRLEIAEDWSAFLGEHYQNARQYRGRPTASGRSALANTAESRHRPYRPSDRLVRFRQARASGTSSPAMTISVPGRSAGNRAQGVLVGGPHRHGVHARAQRDAVDRRTRYCDHSRANHRAADRGDHRLGRAGKSAGVRPDRRGWIWSLALASCTASALHPRLANSG